MGHGLRVLNKNKILYTIQSILVREGPVAYEDLPTPQVF